MLNIDGSLLVVFAIVWILLFILKKVYFNPVTDLVDSRDSEVENNLKVSREALESHDKNIAAIEEQLKKAKVAARKTKDRFISEGQKEKENIVAEMARESRLKLEKARDELEEQIESIKENLGAESEILSEKIAQRLLD